MTSTTRALAVFLALIMATSMVGMVFVGGVAAEETTETLAGDGTDEILEFEADADRAIEHTLEADGADFGEDTTETVYLNVSYDDYDHFEYDAAVDDADADYTAAFDASDLETIPGDAGDTVTVEVTTWGEDADGTETTAADTFEVDLVFDDEYGVIFIQEADDVEDEERWIRSDILTADYGDDTTLAADNGTVHVHSVDDDLNDAVDLATESTDDGDRVGPMMATTLDGSLTYVYDAEPGETITGDDVEDEGNAYIVVHDDDYYEVVPADDFDADDEIDVDLVANDRPSMGDLQDDLEYGMLAAFAGAWGLSIPLLSGLLVAGVSARTGA